MILKTFDSWKAFVNCLRHMYGRSQKALSRPSYLWQLTLTFEKNHDVVLSGWKLKRIGKSLNCHFFLVWKWGVRTCIKLPHNTDDILWEWEVSCGYRVNIYSQWKEHITIITSVTNIYENLINNQFMTLYNNFQSHYLKMWWSPFIMDWMVKICDNKLKA